MIEAYDRAGGRVTSHWRKTPTGGPDVGRRTFACRWVRVRVGELRLRGQYFNRGRLMALINLPGGGSGMQKDIAAAGPTRGSRDDMDRFGGLVRGQSG
jgi:hypothetical protein